MLQIASCVEVGLQLMGDQKMRLHFAKHLTEVCLEIFEWILRIPSCIVRVSFDEYLTVDSLVWSGSLFLLLNCHFGSRNVYDWMFGAFEELLDALDSSALVNIRVFINIDVVIFSIIISII